MRTHFNLPMLRAVACCLQAGFAVLALSSCLPSSQPEKRVNQAVLLKEIEAIAKKADCTFEDAWFCERTPRVLKTGYRSVSADVKAQFAMDYQKMLIAKGENLARDLNTYVPYQIREDFANAWWRRSSYRDAFAGEPEKKKIQWIYESLLDADELWWRAWEMNQNGQIDSAAVAAHYKEQDMVSNYMESESEPGSFSDRYALWTRREAKSSSKETD